MRIPATPTYFTDELQKYFMGNVHFTRFINLLGIPDTSLSGRRTRTALRVRKSKSAPTVVRILKKENRTKDMTKMYTRDVHNFRNIN